MPAHTRPVTDMLIEAFLDGLDLGRLEWQREQYDFPHGLTVPTDDSWPYSDEDED